MYQPKQKYSLILLFFTALLFFTPFRMVVVVLMPFLVYLVNFYYHLGLTKKGLILTTIYIIPSLIGVCTRTTDIANAFLSIWIITPLIILMFSNVKVEISKTKFDSFFNFMQSFLVIIDIIGFIMRYFILKTDDEFGFAYGRNFQYVSGLAVMNVPFLLYHLLKIFNKTSTTANYFYLIFFALAFISCFFGLGLICLMITLIVFFLLKNRLRGLLYIFIGGLLLFYTFKIVSPDTLTYNVNNIDYVVKPTNESFTNARKVLMFYNYYQFVKEHPLQAMFGTGGGGYNSRVAFLLNKESDNIFTAILGHHMPPYHKSDAYPLWNQSVANFNAHSDGTRNKPFSSIVGLAAEEGLIFLFIFLIFWTKNTLLIYRNMRNDIYMQLLFCLNIFWFLSMLSEVWLESSEFLFFLFLQNMILSTKYETLNDTEDNTLLLAE